MLGLRPAPLPLVWRAPPRFHLCLDLRLFLFRGYRYCHRCPPPLRIGPGHVLHPFSDNRFDAGPARLLIAHAFSYRVTVLQSGIKSAERIARSKKAERCLMDNVSVPWGQQVVVMFQIVSTLTLDVPAAAGGVSDLHSVFPNVLLSSEPWGHAGHTGVAYGCCSSDWTGAYVHALTAAHGGSAGLRPSRRVLTYIRPLSVLRCPIRVQTIAPRPLLLR